MAKSMRLQKSTSDFDNNGDCTADRIPRQQSVPGASLVNTYITRKQFFLTQSVLRHPSNPEEDANFSSVKKGWQPVMQQRTGE